MTRSIWHQVLGNCKTEASAKPVPMDSYKAEDLLRWRRYLASSFRPSRVSRRTREEASRVRITRSTSMTKMPSM